MHTTKKHHLFDFKKLKEKRWYSYLGSIFAGLVNSLGVSLFLVPSGLLDGGLSGTSMFLGQMTGLSISIFIVALNLPFFLFALKKNGIVFIVSSLVSILSYAFFNFLFSDLLGLDVLLWQAIDDLLLCAIFGGLISGMGSGLTIRFGGAMDGVEIMAVNFSKRLNLTVGQFVMIYNVILYVIACIITQNIKIGLYSIVTYAVGLMAVDFVVDGLDKGKAVNIITEKGTQVARAISQQMHRSVTVLKAKGFYSNTERTMLYVVVNRFEIGTITKIVKSIDDVAFLTITDVSDVIAQNDTKFDMRRKKRLQMLLAQAESQRQLSIETQTETEKTENNPTTVVVDDNQPPIDNDTNNQ